MLTQNQHLDALLKNPSLKSSEKVEPVHSITGDVEIVPYGLLSELKRNLTDTNSRYVGTIWGDYLIPVSINNDRNSTLHDSGMSLDWYINFLLIYTKELGQKDMIPIINGIHGLILNNKFRLLGGLFSQLINEKASTSSIVCLFRATALAKNMIPNWYLYLEKSKDILLSKNIDPKRVLVGLA